MAMGFKSEMEGSASSIILAGNDQSKTSFDKPFSEKPVQVADAESATNTPSNNQGSKPASETSRHDFVDGTIPKPDTTVIPEKAENTKSNAVAENRKSKMDVNRENNNNAPEGGKPGDAVPKASDSHNSEAQKKPHPTATKPSEKVQGNSKICRPRPDFYQKKPTETPKPKSLRAGGTQRKTSTFQSKLPVKTTEKEVDGKQEDASLVNLKNDIDDSMKVTVKTSATGSKKVQQALEEDFRYLVPLYQKEFKRISDVWVNTIYCSLTMRTNLVKLLFHAFPAINRNQFRMEDTRLVHCLAHAKSCNKSEAESLIKFVRNLIASRDKTKEEYAIRLENKEIANYHNNDWKNLVKRIADLGEQTKTLQVEAPELQRKKETSENKTNEKIRRMELNLSKKEDEIKKVVQQLNALKEKEVNFKENVLLKIPDYHKIKAEVQAMMDIQKEYDELKVKYLFQNYTFEKKIKDLENLVEEKKKILLKEREIKKHLQTVLDQLQDHQKRLSLAVGKDQLSFFMGRPPQERGKRREQLWMAAAKLVLRGFLIQMKKLERDRNKMLLEVQKNDLENTMDATFIIQKDNFINSIKEQMSELQKFTVLK